MVVSCPTVEFQVSLCSISFFISKVCATKMTDNHIEKLDEFKEKRKKTFWAILEKTLPSKVLELNELLASEKFSLERIKNIHVSSRARQPLRQTFQQNTALVGLPREHKISAINTQTL